MGYGDQLDWLLEVSTMIINVLTGMLCGVALWLGWATNRLTEIHRTLWLAAIIMPLATALAVFARFGKGQARCVAHALVLCLQRRLQPKLKEAIGLLAGVMMIALICWTVIGSCYALGIFLYGVLLAALLSYFLYGLIIFAKFTQTHMSWRNFISHDPVWGWK